MTIADLSDLRVIGRLDESEVGRVEAGQLVRVSVDAYTRQAFEGRVERVASIGVEESNVVTFDVEIAITDEEASLLRSGMSADVQIVTREVPDALLVPLTALSTVGGRQTVTLEGGEVRAIGTGVTSGSSVEVVRGLEEGDVLVMGGGAEASEQSAPTRTGSAMGGMGRGPRR